MARDTRTPAYRIKQGKLVWLHHEAEGHLDAYLEMADINETAAPVFQTLNKNHRLTGEAITRRDICVSSRNAVRPPESICNHTFRGTGITVLLQNGGALERRRIWRIIPTRARQALRSAQRPCHAERNRAKDCV
jgi:hypothetical protein